MTRNGDIASSGWRAASLRWLALFLSCPLASEASRDHRPMGYYINRADLIVIADAGKPEWDGNPADFAWEINRMPVRFPISAREVLKGDAGLVGQEIVLRHEQVAFLGSKGFAYISPDARGIAVLLEPGWKEARAWPVLEVYRTPEEIAALRTLVGICAIGRERDRLIQLRALHAAGNPIFREEFIAQLRDMRDPANFHFLTDLYPTLDPKDQLELVEIMGWIGDARGVPTLLEAVNSPDPKVSWQAVEMLRWHYPGALGVAETFAKNLDREHLRPNIAGYLARHAAQPGPVIPAEGLLASWRRLQQWLDPERRRARRTLSERSRDDRMRAYWAMGQLGTAEDLELLLPLADFWTGDRENHHWAMSAVASIRERCGLDVAFIGQGPEAEPTLELEKPVYVLGEVIQFWIGVSAKAGKTIPRQYWTTCFLHITRPDGTRMTERVPWAVDGWLEHGFRGSWGFGREKVQVGTYTLVFEFARKRTGPVQLNVRQLDVMKQIAARFSFQKKGAVRINEAIPVVFEVTNGTSHLLRLPVLGAQHIEISMSVVRETPPERADFFYPHEKLPGAKVTLSMDGPAWAWLGRIPFVVLKAGEKYEFHLSVEDAYRFPGAGKYEVKFMTTIPLLLGEADGEFAEVCAIRFPVESTETFTVTGDGERDSGQPSSSGTPCEPSAR